MQDALGSRLKSAVRLSLYVCFTVPMMAVQIVALGASKPLARNLPLWYHRQCCRLLGIRIERRGRQSRKTPTLFASNHVSYLDILVLGSLVPGSFVAKAEVKSWPLFGWLARLQRSVFVDRRPSKTARQRDEIMERLVAGDNLIIFPEGTSGDGNRVLPFKSALMSAAASEPNGVPLAVQPVTVAYTKLDGLPLGRSLRPFYAWYGDMDLAPHLWHLAGLGRLTVVVHFHPLITLAELGSRKALAAHCKERVQEGLAAALSGRPRRAAETQTLSGP
ncbi:MAG: lysophospholipid acyltransferase family protein [Pseudomonadota bacterium]